MLDRSSPTGRTTNLSSLRNPAINVQEAPARSRKIAKGPDWSFLASAVRARPAGGLYRVPSAQFQPGDVIQFKSTVFRDGIRFPQHTAIVASVDGNGHVTSIYQQNFNCVRAVTRQSLDLSQLVGGSVKLYRPQARVSVAGRFQFTIVNNTAAPVRVVERAGPWSSSYSLSKANTMWSYQIRGWTTYGGITPTINVGGKSISVENGSAYEIVNNGTGLAIRRWDR